MNHKGQKIKSLNHKEQNNISPFFFPLRNHILAFLVPTHIMLESNFRDITNLKSSVSRELPLAPPDILPKAHPITSLEHHPPHLLTNF
jgi:hypothetical protein